MAVNGLIAAKIIPVYKHVRKLDELSERHDLSIGDVMSMGAVSIIEAALLVDVESEHVHSMHGSETTRHLGKLLTASRLVPAINSKGMHVYGTANGSDERIVDPVVLVESEDDLSEYGSSDADVELDAVVRDIRQRLLQGLSDRQIYALSRRFGIAGTAEGTFDEIGSDLGVTRERVRQIHDSALIKTRTAHGIVRPYVRDNNFGGVIPEEFYETWLPEA